MICNIQETGNMIKKKSSFKDLLLLDNGHIQTNPWGITGFTNSPTQGTNQIGFQLIYGSTQTGTQTKLCSTNAVIDWSKYKHIRITYNMGLENRSGFVGQANGQIRIGNTAIVNRNRTQSTAGYITETLNVPSTAKEVLSLYGYLNKTNTFGVGGSVDLWVNKIELLVK